MKPGSYTYIFICSSSVIPLAGWPGKATEYLAERRAKAGGLLNATFGNAAELAIIALMALKKA
ncbi:MAG: hypothetical protein U1F57_03710 [bacterium]